MEDCRSAMKPMGLYVKGEFVSRLSRKQLVVLLQLFRIINSLEVWERFHHVVNKEPDEMFDFRNRLELHFVLISFYKEATKEFCHSLADGLLSMKLSAALHQRVSGYRAWLENWRQDEYLQVVDRIRNCVRFHMRASIYDSSIRDGNAREDLLIGYAIGDRYIDFLYTEPYTHELSYIAEIVPEGIAAGQDRIIWILNRSLKETNRFLDLLRDAVREILKGNTYQKHIDISHSGGAGEELRC
jgi:hypothetical protein